MIITPEEKDRILRQVLDEVARRIGIDDPEMKDSTYELPDLIEAVGERTGGRLVRQVMELFRMSYRRWYDKSLQLEQAAVKGEDLTAIRMELMGLMKERDETRQALIRYLDHYYPRSASRIAAKAD
jgi:hypothetical protein